MSPFEEMIYIFKRQLSTFRLNHSEKVQHLAEKWACKNFIYMMKDTTLVEFGSICRVLVQTHTAGLLNLPLCSCANDDSIQEWSKPYSSATRMLAATLAKCEQYSVSRTSAFPDRSFVYVVVNPGYVSSPRSPVIVSKKPNQGSFSPWVAPHTHQINPLGEYRLFLLRPQYCDPVPSEGFLNWDFLILLWVSAALLVLNSRTAINSVNMPFWGPTKLKMWS